MKKTLLLAIFALCCTSISAQRLKEGDLNFLKGEKELNIIVDYSHIIFKFGNGIDEEKYVERQAIKEGEQWREKWMTLKDSIKSGSKNTFLFKEFNLALFERGCTLRGGNFAQANYTMNIVIKEICIGEVPFDDPYIVLDIFFTKTNSTDKIAVFKTNTTNIMAFANMEWRVETLHKQAGKKFGYFIANKIKF